MVSSRIRRVLHLSESPYFGGITSHILTVAQAFAGHPRYEVVVATLPGKRADRALIEQGRRFGVTVHELPLRGTFDPRVLSTLRHFIADQEIALVHTHNYRSTIIAALSAGHTPWVNTFHGTIVDASRRLQLWQAVERWCMRRQPHVIACSGFVKDWLVRSDIPEDSVHVVPNACMPPVPVDGADARRKFGFSDDTFVLVYVGRLVAGKGIDTLLRAAQNIPDTEIVLVGDGPLRPELETMAAELTVRTRFAGFTAFPGEFFASADVVVLPSAMEAMPMALIEGASWGKPAVATAVGGIPEIVEDGMSGLLVPVGDDRAFHDALTRMRDTETRARMGARARAIWETRFSPPVFTEALAQVYDSILS